MNNLLDHLILFNYILNAILILFWKNILNPQEFLNQQFYHFNDVLA